MNQTIYEKGIEEGRLDLVCSLIEERFGPVSEVARRELERLSAEQLRHLALKVGTAGSLADLDLPA
jgi:hypothetical protein